MKKAELVSELERRFIIHGDILYLKTAKTEGEVKNSFMKHPKTTIQDDEYPLKPKKWRITPQLVGEIGSQPDLFQPQMPKSNALKRVLKKADEMEDYYKTYGSKDQYPSLAF